jgi:prolyl-tRNA synthetase
VKTPVALADIGATASKLLVSIQNDMFTRARNTYYSRLKEVTRWEDVVPALDDKNVVVIPWCEVEACEDDIKERSGRA